jgi:hypothetical protein
MEEKKLKEIEAKLQQLLVQGAKSRKSETATPIRKKIHGAGVIRRRKGHTDLHIV